MGRQDAVILTGGETPNANASATKVIAHYASHRSALETSAILIALAFLFPVLFAGSLRSYLRRTLAAEGLAALSLAGRLGSDSLYGSRPAAQEPPKPVEPETGGAA